MFAKGLLDDMDWSNVVLVGGAVLACLLPVPPNLRDRFCRVDELDVATAKVLEPLAKPIRKLVQEAMGRSDVCKGQQPFGVCDDIEKLS